ncbi:unnamed protein product [Didymodactylos carnosus]|uniref:methylated diphthine methylhydrolase n=2 Tax=Didymodactylos carnosus TaxID=1234261 RepID=A0A814JSE0_9BILA|nr:unnamed protein product [Didymodactylos carnosus]CAF3811725.1 unnamed protein product [Didymodactylos carnosus]
MNQLKPVTLSKFSTDNPPDSVEWCPTQSTLFVCGTYLYDGADKSRKGSIFCLNLNESTNSINTLQHLNTNGILDMQWLQHDSTYLSTICSNGQFVLYSLTSDQNEPLKQVLCEDVTADQTLGLTHNWYRPRDINQLTSSRYLVVGDQSGSLTLAELNTNGLEYIQQWQAHDYECWTCAFDYTNSNIVFSGADDCLFKIWDIREQAKETHLSREHKMGVCSIAVSPFDEHQFLTGSFDEYLRQWDKRMLDKSLKETKLNAGVWKIKYHPQNAQNILCACMANGFHIVDNTNLTVKCSYTEHTSLAYGCDWKHRDPLNELASMNMDDHDITNNLQDNDNTVATCSFYDKSVHVWKTQTIH